MLYEEEKIDKIYVLASISETAGFLSVHSFSEHYLSSTQVVQETVFRGYTVAKINKHLTKLAL